MSQRESGYARKERDFYATPPWVTEALLPHLPSVPVIWEPAAGDGRMANVLEHHAKVMKSDIEGDLDTGVIASDFLLFKPWASLGDVGAIITNPPYETAQAFIERALHLMEPCQGLVAMLLRCDFDHAKSRMHLFRDCPAFAKKLVLMKRIVWFEAEPGKPKAAPSFNHAWYLWSWRHDGPPVIAYGP